MTANTSLRVSEIDFDSIKTNLKTFLRSQSEFQDFDFDGAGMSVLIDLLAYNTHYMAYYLNMVANEGFLDTAQLRSSIISNAKLVNYVPDSPHGAETKLNITVTPSQSESESTIATIQKYTRFIGTDIDGVHYPFVTPYSNSASKVDGSFQFANVTIKQGDVVSLQYLMTPENAKRAFRIPSANVDTTTLRIIVQESTSNTYSTEYTLADDITEISANSCVYFVEETPSGDYSLYFGDNRIGKRPKDGNIITATYIDTVGSAANKIGRFSLVDPIGGLFSDNVQITATSATYGGSNKETLEQVKFRAPYFYTAQNRAVTELDYETLLTKDYENIDSVAVWGGEDNDPPIYGKVFISLKTKDNYFLTNVEKQSIKDTLIQNRNVLTVIPEIVDPDYTYLLVRGTLYYNTTLTSSSADNLKGYIRAAILDYKERELSKFSSTFRKAKLQNYMETSDQSITGSDLRVLIQKRVELDLNQTKNYTFDFGMPIKKGDFASSLSSYPLVTVLDGNSVQRDVFFEEISSISSGISEIAVTNPGINYTSTPTVVISGDGSGATATAKMVGGRIVNISITNPGTGYSRATVVLSGGGGSEAQAAARLESRNARLKTYYIKANGEKVTVSDTAGTINYDTGLVVLTSLNAKAVKTNSFYDTNILTINVPVDKEIIAPLRNRILDIDENDPLSIQLTVSPETT